jgi:hypothetical protein
MCNESQAPPDVDVAAAGGWSDPTPLKTCYQEPDVEGFCRWRTRPSAVLRPPGELHSRSDALFSSIVLRSDQTAGTNHFRVRSNTQTSLSREPIEK